MQVTDRRRAVSVARELALASSGDEAAEAKQAAPAKGVSSVMNPGQFVLGAAASLALLSGTAGAEDLTVWSLNYSSNP